MLEIQMYTQCCLWIHYKLCLSIFLIVFQSVKKNILIVFESISYINIIYYGNVFLYIVIGVSYMFYLVDIKEQMIDNNCYLYDNSYIVYIIHLTYL